MTPERKRFTSNAPAREAGLGHERSQRLRDALRALAFEEPGHVRSRDQHEVAPRYLGGLRPETVSEGALHGISLYGAADLAAHGDPQAGVLPPGLTRPSRKG